MNYPNIMLDIEALDVAPTNRAVIVSVGMVKFDIREKDDWSTLKEPGRWFYAPLPMQIQIDAGRTISANTLQWWLKQTKGVQEALRIPDEDEIAEVLNDTLAGTVELMQDFMMPWVEEDADVRHVSLWAKPAHFDCPKLETLFTDFGYEFPIPWFCYKCMSSYKVAAKLVGIRDPKFPKNPEMIAHNALDDAREQVLELQGWYQSIHSLRG
jgi:hypothetical protein